MVHGFISFSLVPYNISKLLSQITCKIMMMNNFFGCVNMVDCIFSRLQLHTFDGKLGPFHSTTRCEVF